MPEAPAGPCSTFITTARSSEHAEAEEAGRQAGREDEPHRDGGGHGVGGRSRIGVRTRR